MLQPRTASCVQQNNKTCVWSGTIQSYDTIDEYLIILGDMCESDSSISVIPNQCFTRITCEFLYVRIREFHLLCRSADVWLFSTLCLTSVGALVFATAMIFVTSCCHKPNIEQLGNASCSGMLSFNLQSLLIFKNISSLWPRLS